MEKLCIKCKLIKEVSCFKKGYFKDGYSNVCKDCVNIRKAKQEAISEVLYKEALPSTQKCCNRCNTVKPISRFRRNKFNIIDGRMKICKDCEFSNRGKHLRQLPYVGDVSETTRICNKCNVEQSLDEYYERKGFKKGRIYSCKKCLLKSERDRAIERKDGKRQCRNVEYKICPRCYKNKEIDCFGVAWKTSDGHSVYCLQCNRERSAVYDSSPEAKAKKSQRAKKAREEDPEKFKKRSREYGQTPEGAEYKRNYLRKWRKENKAYVLERERKYKQRPEVKARLAEKARSPEYKARRKRKREEDPCVRIAGSLRTRLARVVRGKLKSGSAVDDLGCPIEALIKHIEEGWVVGMDWDNYGRFAGKWTIDHIVPLGLVDLTDRESLVQICNYKNLRPLWWFSNSSKRDQWPDPADIKIDLTKIKFLDKPEVPPQYRPQNALRAETGDEMAVTTTIDTNLV